MKRTFNIKDSSIIFKLVNAATFYSQFKIVAMTFDEIKIIDKVGTSFHITPDKIVVENLPKYITPSIIETIIYDNCDEIQPIYSIVLSKYELRYIQDIMHMLNNYASNLLKYTIENTQDLIDIIAWAALPSQSYEIVATDTHTIEIKHRGWVIRIWDNQIVTGASINDNLMAYIHTHCLDISGNVTISVNIKTTDELISKLKAQQHDKVIASILKTIEEQLP
ncbi:hypothetical protein GQ473_02040 [archaeon]|nr:hypothetical protein [archaeon]